VPGVHHGLARLISFPQWGGLHQGHARLIQRAVADCLSRDRLVSVFINPLQFGEGEDLERYPRSFEADCISRSRPVHQQSGVRMRVRSIRKASRRAGGFKRRQLCSRVCVVRGDQDILMELPPSSAACWHWSSQGNSGWVRRIGSNSQLSAGW